MTIRIGTIQEIKGEGYEILVDEETRSYVLARFLNGNLVSDHFAAAASVRGSVEPTLALGS